MLTYARVQNMNAIEIRKMQRREGGGDFIEIQTYRGTDTSEGEKEVETL